MSTEKANKLLYITQETRQVEGEMVYEK